MRMESWMARRENRDAVAENSVRMVEWNGCVTCTSRSRVEVKENRP